MSETILDTIPVKDKSDLSRDVHSNAIINTNRSAYEMAVKRSKDAKKQRREGLVPCVLRKHHDLTVPSAQLASQQRGAMACSIQVYAALGLVADQHARNLDGRQGACPTS